MFPSLSGGKLAIMKEDGPIAVGGACSPQAPWEVSPPLATSGKNRPAKAPKLQEPECKATETELGTITVVGGGGLLGSHIAAWLVLLGHTVHVVDSRVNAVPNSEHALIKIGDILTSISAELRKTWPTFQEPNQCYSANLELRVFQSDELPVAVKDSWLLIEAVRDQRELKQTIFENARRANPDMVLTSNSMHIDPAQLASSMGMAAGSIFRMRFLFPVLSIPYVEVEETPGAEVNVARVSRWLGRNGMIPFKSDMRIKIEPSEMITVQTYFETKVAAAVIPGLSHIGPQSSKDALFDKTETCVVCMDAEPVIMSIGACNHICMCTDCARAWSFSRSHPSCPLCRQTLSPAVRLE